MNTKSKKQILYGEANYKNMVIENGYYVDKTGFIPLLEKYKNPVFLRPRRFGRTKKVGIGLKFHHCRAAEPRARQ